MTSPNKNVHTTSLVHSTLTMYHVPSIELTNQNIYVMDTSFILIHLYHYQWKDGLTLVCAGGSEDMDWEQHFTTAFIVIIV